jgi:hypothetical protein
LRALFSFDEAMTPAAFGVAYQIVSGFIFLFALFGALGLATTLNTGNFFATAVMVLAPIGAGVAVALLLRLLGEIWMTQLRVQDRLGVLVEQGRERRIG